MNIVGIDIGGTNFRIGIYDDNAECLSFEKVPVGTVFHSGDVLGDLEDKIVSFSDNFRIDAAAIGFPATLDKDRTRVIQAPNIPFMEDLPVSENLSASLGIPVFAERDVVYALCYDMDKYQLPDRGVTCGIYFGTGIGNAIAIDGVPFTGAHGTAGELGHIPAAGCDVVCGCGNVGCLEAIAGGKALAELQAKSYPSTPIGDMFEKHAEDDVIRNYVDLMAIAVATEVNLLDPDHMLLGGGILSMKGFPREYLTQRIMARLRKPMPMEAIHLVYTEDEPDKSVVGGTLYARRKLEKKKVRIGQL